MLLRIVFTSILVLVGVLIGEKHCSQYSIPQVFSCAADLAMDLVVSDPAVEAIEGSFKSTKLFCVL